MPPEEDCVCGAEETQALISGMAANIWDGRRQDVPFYLVGIRTRGVLLAQRLTQELTHQAGDRIPAVGALDITLYRDDLGQNRRWPVLHGTEIPFAVDGAEIVLVDDVLFTGRTIRAALNAVCDLGRPARIRLAVLVDRGHRELPIEPQIVGIRLPTNLRDRVAVRLHPHDPVDEIVRIVPARPPEQTQRRPMP